MCPRQVRQVSNLDIYHIIVSGSNLKKIFPYDHDKIVFLNILENKSCNLECEILAYCILDDHAHFVIKERNSNIPLIMQRINTSYASYFNKKYFTYGSVFNDRYKSEAIKSTEELIKVIKFIHENPKMHHIVNDFRSYCFSSFKYYENLAQKNNEYIVDFMNFSYIVNSEGFKICMESDESVIENYALKLINDYVDKMNIDLDLLTQRNYYNHKKNLILLLKDNTNLSIRKISSILNLNRGVVYKIIVNYEKEGD